MIMILNVAIGNVLYLTVYAKFNEEFLYFITSRLYEFYQKIASYLYFIGSQMILL